MREWFKNLIEMEVVSAEPKIYSCKSPEERCGLIKHLEEQVEITRQLLEENKKLRELLKKSWEKNEQEI